MAFNVGEAVGYLDLDTSGFTGGFRSALSALETFQSESATAGDKISALGGAFTSAGSSLTKSITVPVLGLGTAAVATTATFDQAMSQVAATMGYSVQELNDSSSEAAKSYEKLRDFAQEMGAKTKFSAVQAAEALNYMALAGYDAETSIRTLPVVLNLASAGNMDLARASDMVTDAQTAFGLSLEETFTMADQMAMAASKSNTSVSQLGDAFLTVGATARSLSGGTQEAATILGVLADNGIKASEAGTHLRNIILAMTPKTDRQAGAWARLGVEAYDAEGNLRNLSDVFLDLNSAMEGMTQEERTETMSNMFHVTDLAAVNSLLGTTSERYEELGRYIGEAAGSAGEMADVQLNNLSGQLTILKSALEGMAIAFGDLLMPAIRKVTSEIQSAVDWVNNLDEAQKEQIVRIAGIVAAIGPALLIGGKLITGIGSLLTIGSKISSVFTVLKGVLAGIGAPVIAVVAVIATLAAAFKHLWDTNEEFREKITETWESIKTAVDEFSQGVLDRINSLGFDFESISEVLKAVWEGFCSFLEPIFTGVFDQIAIVLETAFDVILDIFDVFIKLFQGDWGGAWESVKGIFSDLWEGIKGVAENAFETLRDAGSVFLGWFGTTWEELWQNVKDFFQRTWESIKSFFTETIPQLISDIGDWFAELPGKIGYAIGFAIGTLARWAVDMFNTAKEEVPKIIDKIIEFFKELPGKVADWFGEVIPKIGEWAVDLIDDVKVNLPIVIDNIVGFFKELPDKIYTVGKDLIAGLWNGITDRAEQLWRDIKDFGGGVIRGFKEAFDSHSPSRKMRKEGNFLMEGLSEGMEEGESSVLSTIGQVSEMFLNRLEQVVAKLGDLFSRIFYAFSDPESQIQISAYNSTLSETLGIYLRIRDCMESCVQLSKDLFSNTVLPAFGNMSQMYSAIPVFSSVGSGSNYGRTAVETTIVPYLTQIIQAIDNIGDSEDRQPVTIVVNAGTRELTRQVIDDINSITRTTGRSPLK